MLDSIVDGALFVKLFPLQEINIVQSQEFRFQVI